MTLTNRMKYLKIALIIIGAVFTFGLYPLTIYWPSGWAWHTTGPSLYLQMIIGVYATLGVFLLRAAKDPMANTSLIWFTVWSSAVHGLIMAIQSIVYPQHICHLFGDAPILLLIAAVLGFLMPKNTD